MPKQTFVLNGKPVTVHCDNDIRVLWVLRDLLGVTGPKYGCGIDVCKACTSHINGRGFNPCSVRVGDLVPDDHITTIEGLPHEHENRGRHGKHNPHVHREDDQASTSSADGPDAERHKHRELLHPMQKAWLDRDVPQCGYCQPGQIMAAVALVHKVRRERRKITEKDLDGIRNICRCGTYARIREAIEEGARHM
jgi:isoquinoline 1-oxidoreductase alpha subunit